MKTESIQSNNSFTTILKASAVGGVAGYAAKYMLPLTSDEMDAEYRGAMEIIKKESQKAKHKAIESIRTISDKTLAQDTFIKMVDAQEGTYSNKQLTVLAKERMMNNIIKSSLDKSERPSIVEFFNNLKTQSAEEAATAIAEIRGKETPTLIEKTILSVIDSQADEKAIRLLKKEVTNAQKAVQMRKIINGKTLTNADKIQLKSIIGSVNEKAADMFRRCASGYNGAVKKGRSTGLFIAAGIVTGFVAGLANNVLKTTSNNAQSA